MSDPKNPEVASQTGQEMLQELSNLDCCLEVLQAQRNALHGRIVVAANYAQDVSDRTGHVFENPLAKAMEVEDGSEATDPETLTPEEQAYKESLLEGLEDSHQTYTSLVEVMNARRKIRRKIPVADLETARTAAEILLTPDVIRAAMAEIQEFTANPEANSPEPGFDLLFVANANLAASDETALADHIQTQIPAYQDSSDPYTYESLHNQDTAHRSEAGKSDIIAFLAPRHLNVRAVESGTLDVYRDGVIIQREVIKARNQNPDTPTSLVMANDYQAMTHIAHLIRTNAIDTTTPGYDLKRFCATSYSDLFTTTEHYPKDLVPQVCIDVYGRLRRGECAVAPAGPSRALVVSKT